MTTDFRVALDKFIYGLPGMNKVKTAIGIFDKGIKLNEKQPENAELFFKGYALCKIGRYSEAFDCFERYHNDYKIGKYNADALFFMGYALKELERFSDAQASLTEYIHLAPEKSESFYIHALSSLGYVEKELGLYGQAKENFEKLGSLLNEHGYYIPSEYEVLKYLRISLLEYVYYYLAYLNLELAKINGDARLQEGDYYIERFEKRNDEPLTHSDAALGYINACITQNRKRNDGLLTHDAAIVKKYEIIELFKSSGTDIADDFTKQCNPAKGKFENDNKQIYTAIEDLRLFGNNISAVDIIKKITFPKSEKFYVSFYKGCALSSLAKYEEALESFQKCLAQKPEDIDVLFNIANTYKKWGKCDKAIECFKICENHEEEVSDGGKIETFFHKGSAFNEIGEYAEAIRCFDQCRDIENSNKEDAKCMESDNKYTLNNKAYALNGQRKYDYALELLNKVEGLCKPVNDGRNDSGLNDYMLLNRAYALIKAEKPDYREISEILETAQTKNPYNEDIYLYKSVVCQKRGDYFPALTALNEYFKKHRENTTKIRNETRRQGKQDEAILNLVYVIGRLKQENAGLLHGKLDLKGDELSFLHMSLVLEDKVKEIYKAILMPDDEQGSLPDNIDIMALLSMFDDGVDNDETVRRVLDFNRFFQDIIAKETKKEEIEEYKKIYICSLSIIRLLHVNKDCEKYIAHYTNKNVANDILFDKAKIRQNSIVSANDPNEGKPLLKFFDIDVNQRYDRNNYQSFNACFTFDYDSLNQFRLYGKDSGKEGTGISLVLSKDYFKDEIGSSVGTMVKYSKNTPLKRALYRCIYLDTDTKQIISVGRRKKSSFYKTKEGIAENKHISDISSIKDAEVAEYNQTVAEKRIAAYEKEITTILDKVKVKFTKLRGLIKNEPVAELTKIIKIDNEILAKLLLPLRFLVKDVSFKEEQECRIYEIVNLEATDSNIRSQDDYMYIEYAVAQEYIQKVIFAPNMPGCRVFRDKILQNKLNIKCRHSDHALA